MALGKWSSKRQKDMFIAATELPRSPGHPFYHDFVSLELSSKQAPC